MPPKLGILAGGGELPKRLVDMCSKTGRECFVVTFEGQSQDDSFDGTPDISLPIGSAGKIIEALRQANVEEIVMAGRIRRPPFTKMKPDAYAVKFIARIGRRMLGDNSLLSAIGDELESEGFRVVGVHELLDDLTAPIGVIGSVEPSEDDLRDIECGRIAARKLGATDIGQGVIVRAGTVIGSETESGTDAMLEACKPVPGILSGVLIKMKKPGQDKRIDLPAIGTQTVDLVAKSGLKGIAVEAGNALIIDCGAVAIAADNAGVFVIGIEAGDD